MYCYQKVYHIIRPGDTIFWLAQMYDTTVEEIMDNNPGINPQNLQVGSRIVVCPGKAGMEQVGAQMPMSDMPGQPMSGMPMSNMPNQPMNGMPMSNMPNQSMNGMPMSNMPNQPMSGMPMSNMPNQPMNGMPMSGMPNQLMNGMPISNMPNQSMNEMPMSEYQNMYYDQNGYYDPQDYNSAMGYIPPQTDSYGQPESNPLHDDMRRAWAQHVYWTRMLLISIAEHLTDQGVVTTKLMENPQAIADIFAPYFSQEAANEIGNLLTEHLQIGGELITALRDNQMDKANDLNKQWHVNASKIAEALAAMNPNYNKQELQAMLEQHLDLLTEEVAARLARDYVKDIKAFDKSERQAEEMADYLSSGIVQ